MKSLLSSSLRTKVFLLLILLFSIFSVLVIIKAFQDFDKIKHEKQNAFGWVAKWIESEQRRHIDLARQVSLLAINELRKGITGDICQYGEVGKTGLDPELGQFALADPDGKVSCNSIPWLTAQNVADQNYFKQAILLKGEGYIDEANDQDPQHYSAILARALHDHSGNLLKVVLVKMDFSWTSEEAEVAHLPENSHLLLLDGKGKVITGSSNVLDWTDKNIADTAFYRQILADQGSAFYGTGFDGAESLIISHQFSTNAGDMRVVIDVPRDTLLQSAYRNLAITLLCSVVLLVLLFMLVYYWSDKFFLSRMLALERTAQNLADGNLNARAQLVGGDEIGQLAQSFNAMADSLQTQHANLQETNIELQREMDRRRAIEQESARQLHRINTLLQNSMEGIHILDMEGHILEVNTAFCNMLGYSYAEMLRLNVADWDAQRSKTQLLEDFKLMVGKSLQFETEHRRKDGSLINVELSVCGVEIDGRCYIYASSRDISARKQAETSLRIAAVAFEVKESMVITDKDGVILRVNRAFCESTGYTSEEAIGQTLSLCKSGRHNTAFYQGMWEALMRTGGWQGEVWDKRKNGETYPVWLTISTVNGVDGCATHYVGSYVDITERKATEEKIHNLAFYNTLTQLPNRRLLLDRLSHALASSERSSLQGALLFINLDRLSVINNTLGYNIGDLLLQEVANRLKACVRDADTVACLGGDEFVVLLEDLSEQAIDAAGQAELIGDKILTALRHPYQLATHTCRSTPSIGATLFNGHEASIEELLKKTDIAMYQAKQAGRNTLRFFDPIMQNSLHERTSLENQLRQALETQQFQLYYQMQVDSANQVIGAETLIRWIHPELGFVSPAQFIPLAEETDLILPIGLWVLETACAQIKAWEQDATTRELVLAVNVSPKQFRQANFVSQVHTSLQHYGINPARLKLELTEGMLVENIEDIIAVMHTLKALGIQFSLDDFGTGYSSLQYLRKLPLNQLKIDQSFVRDMTASSGDNAIVQTIIAMAHGLNLNVIAEGVETEEQRALLASYGCQHYQGYLFSKPVPVAQFEALLKQG